MENAEEILHSLEEFSKTKPKDIPRELEDYLCFVAKTGDPVYQWSAVKSLFREKMINVITEFYETCPSVEIPPCPNVDLFNYDVMKNFILEKLDTFAAAPFTLQRICELLTTPRKEYNRIDKYMRALEKNILVVSTTEPGGRRTTENGEGVMNGIESDHLPETSNSSNDINVEEMDDTPAWPRLQSEAVSYQNENSNNEVQNQAVQETIVTASKVSDGACTSSQDTVITCRNNENSHRFNISVETTVGDTSTQEEESDVSATATAIPAGVQKRRNSVEPVVSSESVEEITESSDNVEKSSENPKECDSKTEEETSSTQQIEDADSSSSTEDDKDSTDSKEDKTLDILPEDDEAKSELSSTENEENKIINESVVGTSQPQQDEEQQEGRPEIECSKQITVDTTKCSSALEEPRGDLEITSSEKIDEVHSSLSDFEAKEMQKIESDSSEESQSTEYSDEKIDVGEKSDSVSTPMEVDGEYSNSGKIDEIVRAEATSDSPL